MILASWKGKAVGASSCKISLFDGGPRLKLPKLLQLTKNRIYEKGLNDSQVYNTYDIKNGATALHSYIGDLYD